MREEQCRQWLDFLKQGYRWTKTKFVKSTENMCGILLWLDYVFVLSISLEICPNQHFLGVTNLRYVLFKADFRAWIVVLWRWMREQVNRCGFNWVLLLESLLFFFLRILHVLFKVREPVQALHMAPKSFMYHKAYMIYAIEISNITTETTQLRYPT
jgi:hypothetical protein